MPQPKPLALPGWWRSPKGLLLPSTVAQPASPSTRLPADLAPRAHAVAVDKPAPTGLDQIAVYVDEAALGLGPTRLRDLRRTIAEINFKAGALVLARLAAKVLAFVGERDLQLQLAAELFGEGPQLAGIRTFFARHHNAELLAEQQVFVLLRLLLERGRDGDITEELGQNELFVLWLSAVASGSVINAVSENVKRQGRDDWLALFVQNGAYNTKSAPMGEVARAQEIFGRLAREESRRGSDKYCPLDEWMADDYGLTIEEQFTLGFALGSMAHAWDEGWEAGNKNYIPPEHVDDLFVKLGWEDRQEPALELIAADRDRLLQQFQESGDSPAHIAWETRPFKRHPFLRCGDGGLILLSPRMIQSWLSEGFHYRLLDSAQRRSKGDRRRRVSQRYTAFWGELLESYVLRLVRSSYAGERPVGAGRVYGEQPYGKKGEAKTSDVVVDLGLDLVLIEVTGSRLRADTLLLGDPKSVREDLRRTLVAKIAQLDGCINALVNGNATIPAEAPAVDLARVERIWPIVVSASDLTQNGLLWSVIDEETPGRLSQAKVQPLTLLDLEDLEQLLGFVEANHSLPELLEGKTAGSYRYLELAMWVRHDTAAPRELSRPGLVEDLWERVTDRATAMIDFTRGLDGSSGSPPMTSAAGGDE